MLIYISSKCDILCAIGEPEPEVTWLKDDKEIKIKKKDKRIRTDWDMKTDEYILEIKNATKDDVGEYTAVAKNEKGTITVVMTVMFKVKKQKKEEETKPELVEETIEVQETKVAESSTISIEETTVKQVKTDTTLSEEATISADITGGTAQMTEEVTVEEIKIQEKPREKEPEKTSLKEGKPEFVLQPQTTLQIEEGQTITLRCQVKGRDIAIFGELLRFNKNEG